MEQPELVSRGSPEDRSSQIGVDVFFASSAGSLSSTTERRPEDQTAVAVKTPHQKGYADRAVPAPPVPPGPSYRSRE